MDDLLKANVQEVVGVLDRSGSMAGKEADTVGGINSMIAELKSNQLSTEQINVSIKLFDHEEILLLKSMPLNEVKNIDVNQFIPRGQTALLDALGNTLNYFMEKRLMEPKAYDSCLIYLATDGYENASKYYTRDQIKNIIKNAKEQYNIEVVYLGANQDAILEAGNIGINPGQAINYSEDRVATEAVYRAVGRVASSQRSNNNNLSFNSEERSASQTEPQHSPLHILEPPSLKRSRRIV